MSRRSPSALPPQPEDPVPVEHDSSSDEDGGAWMVDACLAPPLFSSMSPTRLLPPPSAWETMMLSMGHLSPPPPSPPWSPQLWELHMGPTANCSAAVLEAAAPKDTSDVRAGIGTLFDLMLPLSQQLLHRRRTGDVNLAKQQVARDQHVDLVKFQKNLVKSLKDLVEICLSHGLEIFMLELEIFMKTGGSSLDSDRINRKTKQLAAVMIYMAISFLTRGYICYIKPGSKMHINIETGGSFLAMLESYDDEGDRINRLTFLFSGIMVFEVKAPSSPGLERRMNTETGGSCFAMIESYDHDNELGDNDAEQIEISRKRPRNSSPVWSYFSKELSEDSGRVTAWCKRCKNPLNGASTSGTSHLLRHLKNVHQIDLSPSPLSKAWKEPQGSSCPQKLQTTGSVACAGSPTPLTENNRNEIELQEKDFELGDTSKKRRKGTSRTKSNIWRHFTKLPSADPRRVRAKCNYCKTTLEAGSQNGTSTLWRHVKKFHEEKVCQEGS